MELVAPSAEDLFAGMLMGMGLVLKYAWPLLLMVIVARVVLIVVERRVARRRYRGRRYLVVELDEE